MKKPTIVVLWILTSSATFALGWMMHSSSAVNVPESVTSEQTTRPSLVPERSPSTKSGNGDSTDGFLLTSKIFSANDMTVAMKALMDEDDPLKRAMMFHQLLGKLTPKNAAAAYAALSESNGTEQGRGRGGRGERGGRTGRGGSGDGEMDLLLNAWGRVDGEGAIEQLMTLRAEAEESGAEVSRRSGPGGTMELSNLLSGWATADADGASAYLDTIEDDRQSQRLTGSVIKGVMLNGVDQAMEFVSNLPEENSARDRYMSTIAAEVLESGIDAGKSWVESINDPVLKGGALSSVASAAAREDLEGAIAWVSNYVAEEGAGDAVTLVAEKWANLDPQAVIDWAAELPESVQAGVYAEALDEWTESDPLAASEYLAVMESSPAKDSAVQGFATELASEDPQAAVAWAETISDDTLRTDTLTSVAQNWYRTDQTAAAIWLESSQLPEEVLQEVIEAPSSRGFRGRGR